jgi:sulfur carrier protein
MEATKEMTVTVNGEDRVLPPNTSVMVLVTLLMNSSDARGVAVAVDSEVVPRSQWEVTHLSSGAQVEVLHAIQGG